MLGVHYYNRAAALVALITSNDSCRWDQWCKLLPIRIEQEKTTTAVKSMLNLMSVPFSHYLVPNQN